MPTAARAGGFQERKVDDMPCWGRTTTLLPLFRMYNPKLPILALPRGCTSLAFREAVRHGFCQELEPYGSLPQDRAVYFLLD